MPARDERTTKKSRSDGKSSWRFQDPSLCQSCQALFEAGRFQLTLHLWPCCSHPLVIAHPVAKTVSKHHGSLNDTADGWHAVGDILENISQLDLVSNISSVCLGFNLCFC